MEYLTGFSFTLDSNNLKWKDYFDSLEKNSIGVYSVTKYFYDNLKDVLSKVFDNDSDITSLSPLSEESLSLSTESFKEWDVTYKDLLSEGEMCCIAIPGYLYKGSAQSCFSVVNNIIKKQVITSKNHSNSLEQKWKTLMASGYSSVTNKTSLLDSTKTAEANLARRAVIYVLEEHDDITDGAEFWDGTDFIAWGLETTPKGIKKHTKFRQYKFIEIPSTIYNSYKSNHSSSIRYSEDGHTSSMPHNPAETHTHKDGKIHYKIPAEVFKNNLTSTGDFQYDTNVSTTYGLTATLSAGESIFWKLSETKTL